MRLSSSETLPQPSRCAESSLRCISSVLLKYTWSTVDLPRRKPACSRGRCGSTTGSMQLSVNLSRILNGMQCSEMGMYDLGSCAWTIWFWEGQDGSMVPGLRELGSSETRREERT